MSVCFFSTEQIASINPTAKIKIYHSHTLETIPIRLVCPTAGDLCLGRPMVLNRLFLIVSS
jgi:hypothetical protein